jgi:hypothetical protein
MTMAALAVAVSSGALLGAQQTTQIHPGKGGSPHVRTHWTIDTAAISIEYGRPALKGRAETTVMPPGQEWRTGADEPTTLTTDKPLRFGALTLPAGTYTLNTLPGTTEWQLLVLKGGQAWGIPYPRGQEIGRAPMTVTRLATPVELLTISVDDTAAGATLRIEWGTTSARIPFIVS